MTQKQKPLETLRERIETCLRKVCSRVSPDRRAAVIVTALVVFAALNIWVTARAIWSIGRDGTPQERITLPDNALPTGTGDPVTDSLGLEFEKFFNEYSNDQDNDTDTEQE
jgi:hypothetical protein